MELNREEKKQLHQALTTAFARADLEQMVMFELDQELAKITRDGSIEVVVFDLINWAARTGRTADLIRGACSTLPGNSSLTAIGNKILREHNEPGWDTAPPAPRSSPLKNDLPIFHRVEPHNFDLTGPVESCVDELLGAVGLFGFVLPVNSPELLDRFCLRVRNELEEPWKVIIKPKLSLDPRIKSVEDTIGMIRKYKMNLAKQDVVFYVQVQDATLIPALWGRVREEFKAPPPNRFIMIIGSPLEYKALDELRPLPAPQFTKYHVNEWIKLVVEKVGWQPPPPVREIISYWTECFIAECRDGDVLRFELVYAHMDEMLELIQNDPPWQEVYDMLAERRGFAS